LLVLLSTPGNFRKPPPSFRRFLFRLLVCNLKNVRVIFSFFFPPVVLYSRPLFNPWTPWAPIILTRFLFSPAFQLLFSLHCRSQKLCAYIRFTWPQGLTSASPPSFLPALVQNSCFPIMSHPVGLFPFQIRLGFLPYFLSLFVGRLSEDIAAFGISFFVPVATVAPPPLPFPLSACNPPHQRAFLLPFFEVLVPLDFAFSLGNSGPLPGPFFPIWFMRTIVSLRGVGNRQAATSWFLFFSFFSTMFSNSSYRLELLIPPPQKIPLAVLVHGVRSNSFVFSGLPFWTDLIFFPGRFQGASLLDFSVPCFCFDGSDPPRGGWRRFTRTDGVHVLVLSLPRCVGYPPG